MTGLSTERATTDIEALSGAEKKGRTSVKDYVIRIAPVEPKAYLAHESEDEALDDSKPSRTLDFAMARRFSNFVEARKELRVLVKRFINHQFRLDVAGDCVGDQITSELCK